MAPSSNTRASMPPMSPLRSTKTRAAQADNVKVSFDFGRGAIVLRRLSKSDKAMVNFIRCFAERDSGLKQNAWSHGIRFALSKPRFAIFDGFFGRQPSRRIARADVEMFFVFFFHPGRSRRRLDSEPANLFAVDFVEGEF